MARLRIVLGDDHTLVRQGLRKILEERPDWEVVARGRRRARGRAGRRSTLQPDVAILDIGMPLLNGIEATRQIVRRAARRPRPDPEHALPTRPTSRRRCRPAPRATCSRTPPTPI